MASRDSTMMASSVMLRAASMPAAARSASCRSSMNAMYERSGSSPITSRTASLKIPPALVVGLTADHVLHHQLGPGAAVVPVVHHLEGQTCEGFEVLGRDCGWWRWRRSTRKGWNCAISSRRFCCRRCSR